MTLERISFKKGRKHEPRLSAPYIRGQRSEKHWSDEERKVLLDHYHAKGLAYCADQLPKRSKSAIYGEANRLGLHRKGQKVKRTRTREEYAILDAKISEMWPTLEIPKGDRTGVKEIARRLGEQHWLITQRCLKLGLTLSRKKEPPWSAAEQELMKHVPLHDIGKCAEIFRAHGFTRSPTAIMVKAKRLNLSRRYTEGFSARTAAILLGMDNKTVSVYCLKGIIKSSRRKTNRSPQQGGSPQSITRADLRQFIIDNLEVIDFRKVDKFAIVDLLTNCQQPPPLVG